MKTSLRLTVIALLLAVSKLSAATLYVSLESANPSPPYTNWITAATNIQDAVDVAMTGDEIMVTNGVYSTGGGRAFGDALSRAGGETNRVTVDKPLTMRSVNGPEATIIDGLDGMRCVYLTNGAVLAGFTLTNGRTWHGGGVCCESTNAFLTNCVIAGNLAGMVGGGVSGGTLDNCTLSGNHASYYGGGYIFVVTEGGGAWRSALYNCTLKGNSAIEGGGAYACTLNNSALTGNSAVAGGGGVDSSTLYNCTLTGNSSYRGGGAYSSTLYNCIVYFNTTTSDGANYDTNSTLNYCCTTPDPGGVGIITNAPLFMNAAAGNYRLSPNSPCIDAGTNLSAILTNDLDGRPRPVDGNGDGLAAFDIGAYEYRELLVWQGSPNPTTPYATWATAATNIQNAEDAALAGDQIVVTNAVYPGGVAVIKPLALRSVNGPQLTIIDGGHSNRCVSLTDGASLTGFTLTHGIDSYRGGGVLCASTNAFVINCVIAYNYVGGWGPCEGGGVCRGTLFNCTVSGNSAVVYDTAWGHAAGGGAYGSTLYNCTLTGNFARGGGGGADSSTLYNCIVYFNTASSDLNCDFSSTLNYCCTTPLPTNGVGNITNAPLFVDEANGNLSLQSNSPCINAGNNTYAPGPTDLDGNPRIVCGTVDIGAYEFQGNGSVISYAWLQQYGLPIDGSADSIESDCDGMNNWQEYLADTSPLDANDCLHITSFTRDGTYNTLWWASKSTRLYEVERSESLGAASPWETIITNAAPGWNNVGFDNTGPQYFYRIRAVRP